MTAPPTRSLQEDGKDPIEDLLASCLELPEAEWNEAVERVCREHPDRALELRAQFRLLDFARFELPPEKPDETQVPERLGDFRLQSALGAGGMGIVYRATQESLQREVALKLIRPEHLYFPGARERFQREVEAIARLQHPGIVPVYCVGEERSIPYFAMELVAGCSLTDVIAEAAGRPSETLDGRAFGEFVLLRTRRKNAHLLETPDSTIFSGTWTQCCLRIIRQVALALEHAHKRVVLHRDIKPSNILVTPAGRALLVDFGLASTDGVRRSTRTGSQIGSLPYMSPEQVRGDHADVDQRTDIYALGVTLFELLVQRLPYLGENQEKTRHLILNGKPPTLRTPRSRLSRDVETVCLTALERDSKRRYTSAADFARDLGNVLDLRPIEARRPGLPLRMLRAFQRNPAVGVAVFLAFLLTIVAPAIGMYLLNGKNLVLAKEMERTAVEAKTAEATAGFVLSLFERSNPWNTENNPNITVREFLDRASVLIDTSLKGEPEVRARILHMLGNTYGLVGQPDRSLHLLDQFITHVEAVHGVDSAQAIRARAERAAPYLLQGKFQELRESLEPAIELTRKEMEIHPEQASTLVTDLHVNLMTLADSERELHQWASAEKHYREALDLVSQDGALAYWIPRVWVNFAVVLQRSNRLDEEEAGLKKALELQRAIRPEGSLTEAELLNNQALLLQSRGDRDEAIRVAQQAVELGRRVVSGAHPSLSVALNNLGTLHLIRRELTKARSELEEALTMNVSLLGADNPYALEVAQTVCEVYCQQLDFEHARPLAEMLEAKLLPTCKDPGQKALTLMHLGRCRLHAEDPDEARELFERATNLVKNSQYPWRFAEASRDLSLALMDVGELDLAEESLNDALAYYKARQAESWYYAVALRAMARLHRAREEPEEAETLLLQSLRMLQQVVSAEDPETRATLSALTEFYEDQDRLEDAEKYRAMLDG